MKKQKTLFFIALFLLIAMQAPIAKAYTAWAFNGTGDWFDSSNGSNSTSALAIDIAGYIGLSIAPPITTPLVLLNDGIPNMLNYVGDPGDTNLLLSKVTTTLIPEPKTWSILLLGSVGLMIFASRRQATWKPGS